METAFEILAEQYRPMLLAYAQALLGGDPHEAEDVVQECFLTAHRRLQDFRRGENFGAWLRGIALPGSADGIDPRRHPPVAHRSTPLSSRPSTMRFTPRSPSRSKILNNSANDPLHCQIPHTLNSAKSAVRIWLGTIRQKVRSEFGSGQLNWATSQIVPRLSGSFQRTR